MASYLTSDQAISEINSQLPLKRIEERTKSALTDLKNSANEDCISQTATKRAIEKIEAIKEAEYENGYEGDIEWLQEDATNRREVDDAKVRAERLELTNDEVNLWIKNLLEAHTVREEPDFTSFYEWEKRVQAELEIEPEPLPEPEMPEMPPWIDEMPSMSENISPTSFYDMRANLSLPYGDESLNRSVFELNISDESDTEQTFNEW